jgi:signal transduction histidine kinase
VSQTDQERLAAIGEIAAEIAHELRNVLQIISATAYLARVDPPGSAPHVAKIERNARLAHTIVDDLMALARGEPAHAAPVLVAEVVAAARGEIDPSAAAWTDAVDPADLLVRAHPGLLTRVLHALYDNAIQVSAPRPPAIATRAFAEDGRVVIEIEDDGPGVPADIAPRVFDPLVTGRSGGTGLGLALAKRIVSAHGGSIALVGGDRGARFRIVL